MHADKIYIVSVCICYISVNIATYVLTLISHTKLRASPRSYLLLRSQFGKKTMSSFFLYPPSGLYLFISKPKESTPFALNQFCELHTIESEFHPAQNQNQVSGPKKLPT